MFYIFIETNKMLDTGLLASDASTVLIAGALRSAHLSLEDNLYLRIRPVVGARALLV
jgi:hypothetical protein